MTQPPNPFRYFNSSPEIIRIAVMMYIRFPLSLRNVEDLLAQRGIDISYETVRYWWDRFGPMFAAEIRKKRIERMRFSRWRWHLDEMYVKINGEMHYLWRAVDHEGEVLESYASKTRDKPAALKFIKKLMKRHAPAAQKITTDGLRSYKAALTELVVRHKQEVGRWANNRVENSHQPLRRRERAMSRFRRMKTLQKFASVHASIHNHFNQERHLISHQPTGVQGETLGGLLRVAVSRGLSQVGFGRAPSPRRQVDFSLTAPVAPLAAWIDLAFRLGDDTYLDFTGGERLRPATLSYQP